MATNLLMPNVSFVAKVLVCEVNLGQVKPSSEDDQPTHHQPEYVLRLKPNPVEDDTKIRSHPQESGMDSSGDD
jgi:hypothetical protein